MLSYDSFVVKGKWAFDIPCCHESNYLLPFFGNNRFIEGYLHKNPDCVIKQDFLQDKMMAKAKLVNSPFVYKVHFNDNLSTWNENHFSLRLVNCLMKYPVVPGTVAEYTAREGQLFDQLEDAKYFIFHGSPDIILRRVGVDKNVVVVNEGQEEDGDDQLEEQDEQDLDGNRDQMAAVLKHF